MVEINKNNYEEKIVDYFDGKLKPLEAEMLMSFLSKNPDLKDEFDGLNEVHFIEKEKEQVIFDRGDILKKHSLLKGQKSNFPELCIASIEGDLTDNQQAQFNNLIYYNTINRNELELFKLTKFFPNHQIVFNDKKSLKRSKRKMRSVIVAGLSAAASVAIIIALYITLSESQLTTEHLMAHDKATQTTNKAESPTQNAEIENKVKDETQNTTYITQSKVKAIEPKVKVDIESNLRSNEILNKEQIHIAGLRPLEIKVDETNSNELGIVTNHNSYEIYKGDEVERELTLRSYITQTINKTLFNKDKEKVEVFDIAQAGINGINKITGSQMTLERIYDINGNAKETQFNSRLIAFSTPVKK